MEVGESEYLFLEFSLWNLNSESRLEAFEAHLFGTSKNAGGGACNTKGSVLRGYPLNVPLSMKVTTKIRLVTHLQQEEINMP